MSSDDRDLRNDQQKLIEFLKANPTLMLRKDERGQYVTKEKGLIKENENENSSCNGYLPLAGGE